MILVTGHYGNFEIMGYLFGLFGFNIYSIARPLDNKFINKHLYEVRQQVGQKIIDKKGAAQLMPKLIAEGATVWFHRRPGRRQKRNLRRFLRQKGKHL